MDPDCYRSTHRSGSWDDIEHAVLVTKLSNEMTVGVPGTTFVVKIICVVLFPLCIDVKSTTG